MRTSEEKYATVIQKNTFYFFDADFEEQNESQNIDILTTLLHNLYEQTQQHGVQKNLFDDFLQKPQGLQAVLALNGLSNETLKRIITIIRIVDDKSLNILVGKHNWGHLLDSSDDLKEWGSAQISNLVRNNEPFRQGVINLFFEGASNPMLARILRPFELRKLTIRKLKFDIASMIDTLVRYKQKGANQASRKNNAENLIRNILKSVGIPYTQGDLPLLQDKINDEKRTLDFIIPNKDDPKIIIESSFLSTTGSGQGDKSKTEINVRRLLQSYYPNAKFIGFIDGIGWYVRKQDLKRMITAYDDVFTFHEDELVRFRQLLNEELA
ncbi:MAG TPA: DpnII family type II restriction endonuclease [Aggregatilineales bacterium]|nr:DpnII family type II restriction endonuclease [Aggregatilineales bacterium]